MVSPGARCELELAPTQKGKVRRTGAVFLGAYITFGAE
jgi:hypothetical protein